MKEDVKSSEEYVYCVIEKRTGKRVGQFYSRAKDAINRCKQANASLIQRTYCVAVKFELSNAKEIE